MFGIPKFFGFKNKMWEDNYATLLVGRKRTGKSTILSMVAQEASKMGYKVFSNYPIDNTIKIPKKVVTGGKIVTDKAFLYDNPLLENSFVLLDEVANIWNARSWGKWTEDDADFFNFLGKHNTRVFMAIQYYEMLDLNVRRNLDATYFVTRSIWPNTSVVECDYHDVCKVEDLQTHVLHSGYRKIAYEACEFPNGKYYFRRKKWYPYFLTLYRDERVVPEWDLQTWKELAFEPVSYPSCVGDLIEPDDPTDPLYLPPPDYLEADTLG